MVIKWSMSLYKFYELKFWEKSLRFIAWCGSVPESNVSLLIGNALDSWVPCAGVESWTIIHIWTDMNWPKIYTYIYINLEVFAKLKIVPDSNQVKQRSIYKKLDKALFILIGLNENDYKICLVGIGNLNKHYHFIKKK